MKCQRCNDAEVEFAVRGERLCAWCAKNDYAVGIPSGHEKDDEQGHNIHALRAAQQIRDRFMGCETADKWAVQQVEKIVTEAVDAATSEWRHLVSVLYDDLSGSRVSKCDTDPKAALEAIYQRFGEHNIGMQNALREINKYARHKTGCKVNPGGKIMEALGDPGPRACTCGLDAARQSVADYEVVF